MQAIGYLLSFAIGGLAVWIFLIIVSFIFSPDHQLLLFFQLAVAYFKRKNIRLLFEPHKNWGPQLSSDRRRADFDERAARVRE